ncbi:MAG: hypothetical protein IPH42_03790 [Bacteroidetes bacterium]|nr:hypothetical protein [Bacteroidota bacterium]MBP9796701.1 hypothetical protein [Chitinophagales bacterium]
MREDIQMRNAVDVITTYNGEVPLQIHLKNYCRENKNIGSKDRKILSELVFGYFRMKGNNDSLDIAALLVNAAQNSVMLTDFVSHWKNNREIGDIDIKTELSTYFPLFSKVSESIETSSFLNYLQQKPKIFIRCNADTQQEVVEELMAAGYEFTIKENCIAFEKNYPLDTLQSFEDGLFEIQDIASQHISELFQPIKNEAWWDCCAGSGGKSLLLLELMPQIQLFVSDSRESIIQNLKDRFERHDHTNYTSYILDLERVTEKELLKIPQFNAIIADVPCSGSGTWGRTPEWLSFFTEEKLNEYVLKQRNIISTVTNKLLPGGKIIYITCSVYSDENEINVNWFCENLPLKLEQQKYFQFSNDGGDTLFGAVMQRV